MQRSLIYEQLAIILRVIMTGQNIGYVRVSTVKQNTDRQLDDINLDKIFEDKMTGMSLDRPELKKCLDYVRPGDTLHVHSIDRLARNLRALEELIDSFMVKDVKVVFHKENLTFSGDSDPISKLTLQMMGAYAEFERSMTKSRIKEGMLAAKAKGRRIGRPSIDYSLKDEILKKRSDGKSVSQIAKDLDLSRTSIYKIIG